MSFAALKNLRFQVTTRAFFLVMVVVAIDALLLKHADVRLSALLRLCVIAVVFFVGSILRFYASQNTWRTACVAIGLMLVYLFCEGRVFFLDPSGKSETWTDAVLIRLYPLVRQENPGYVRDDPASSEFVPDLASYLDCGSLLVGLNLALLATGIACCLQRKEPANDEAAWRWSGSGVNEWAQDHGRRRGRLC